MPSSKNHHIISFIFIIFSNIWLLVLSLEQPRTSDLRASSSIAISSFRPKSLSPKSDTSSDKVGYGYPYGIAPTLTPIIHARSDEFDNEAEVTKVKIYLLFIGFKMGIILIYKYCCFLCE